MTQRQSPLIELHRSRDAVFRQIGEMEVPAHFGDVSAEYEAVLASAGVYDACLETRLKMTGAQHLDVLNALTATDLGSVEPHSMVDTYMCNERGGIIDRVMLGRYEDYATISAAPGLEQRIIRWIEDNRGNNSIEVENISGSRGVLMLMGPNARQILKDAVYEGELPERNMTARIVQISQARALVIYQRLPELDVFRIEAGMLFLESVCGRLESAGKDYGLEHIGFDTLEILRIERGIPAHGSEIDENTTPIELGQAMRLDLSGNKWRGRRAVLHSSSAEFQRRLVVFALQGSNAPKPGDPIEMNGLPFGYVTSGALNPRTRQPLGMGFVDAFRSKPGTRIHVRTNDQPMPGYICDSILVDVATTTT